MLDLRPMTEDEYRTYREFAVGDYAAEGAKSSGWSEEEALAQAEAQYRSLLPQDLATPAHHFYSLVDGKQVVGMLWITIRGEAEQRHSFIYDIRIDDAFQGKGYGTRALERLQSIAKAGGAHSIRLHVFGHNQAALRLYQKMGFVPTNIQMRLDLP